MSSSDWVTIVAFDTPFLAQLATEHLDDRGIRSRLLSDSGGETLPHVSFATGGHRVQVAAEDVDAAHTALASLEGIDADLVDVGEFGEDDGLQPPRVDDHAGGAAPRTSSPLRIAGVVLVIVGVVAVSFGILVSLL